MITAHLAGGGGSAAPGVYDVREGFFGNPSGFCAAYAEWLEAHGVDKNATYRTEHLLIDAPLVRVFQYDRNDDGRLYLDPETDDTAKRSPFDLLIRTQPPTPDEYATDEAGSA